MNDSNYLVLNSILFSKYLKLLDAAIVSHFNKKIHQLMTTGNNYNFTEKSHSYSLEQFEMETRR